MGSKAEKGEVPQVPPVPKKGDIIYIPTAGYIGHGMDDRLGGQAKVRKVVRQISGGEPTPFVVTEPFPESMFNWRFLGPQQEELRKRFGDSQARPDPDDRLEFNTSDPATFLSAMHHQRDKA